MEIVEPTPYLMIATLIAALFLLGLLYLIIKIAVSSANKRVEKRLDKLIQLKEKELGMSSREDCLTQK
jgi:hypothetical protein